MTYTDEDILDLYTDLQTVGLAETPYEEVERIRQSIKPEIIKSTFPTSHVIPILLDKGIPHTYVLILRLNPLTKHTTTTAYPLIRGQVLCTSEVLPLDSFIQKFYPRCLEVRQYENLHQMKQGLLEFKVNYPSVSLDKYPYLP